jgi:hypothetical protein
LFFFLCVSCGYIVLGSDFLAFTQKKKTHTHSRKLIYKTSNPITRADCWLRTRPPMKLLAMCSDSTRRFTIWNWRRNSW